ncbi:MAG TPA: hypothetical protein EYN93_13880 [Planctomycetaceae bacterium]|nr:hypothetical protein [Planctomycetaceae bacterium]
MMHSTGSVEIDKPIEDVFIWTNESVAKWSEIVVEDEVINRTPDIVGSTFRSKTDDDGYIVELEGVVTEYDAPYFSAVKMTSKSFDIIAEYTFDDLGGSTRVTQDSFVTGKGFFRWMFLFFGWLMKKKSCEVAQKEMENLKKYCESQPGATNEQK